MNSHRDLPLVLSCDPTRLERPLLTVELYFKWYELWLVQPGGELRSISFGDLENFCEPAESAYRDHTPNPACVRRMVEHWDWDIETLAEELIEGRWILESRT